MKSTRSELVLTFAFTIASCAQVVAPPTTAGSGGGATATGGSGPQGDSGGTASTGGANASGGRSGSGGLATTVQGSGGTVVASGGSSTTGGVTGSGGTTTRGDTGGSTGSTGLGGAAAAGGQPASGGSTTAGGGRTGTSGMTTTGGRTGLGGTLASGGAASTGGASGGSGGTGTGATNANPFGCKFAWGLAANLSGSLAAYSYLQFMTVWIETGMNADGTFNSCTGCNWIKSSVASSNLIPVYYAYIIGFLGHANGLPDGNQTSGQSLTTGGAALIKSKRSQIVQAYADYAKQSYAVWPTKPLVWLMEGDFIQYNDAGQSSPLSMAELVQLAADISTAIKSNMPNAVVAWDHTTWNSDQETKDFWNGMKAANYDLVWTTGVANNNGFIPAGTNTSTYNAATAKYSVVHQLSGKPILVDDGCGGNTNEDWSPGPASVLNARIADGVIAFTHCVTRAPNYQSQIAAIMPQASSTCQ